MSEPILIDIKLEGTIEGISCEKISEGLYKCLESCLFIESVKYGCEIEVEETDGKPNFIKIYKKSPFATYCYVWSKKLLSRINVKVCWTR